MTEAYGKVSGQNCDSEESSVKPSLVFSYENDNIYTDDLYKNQHKDHYLREIQAVLHWYGEIYYDSGIHNRMFIDNDSPSKVVDRIISQYGVSVKKAGS